MDQKGHGPTQGIPPDIEEGWQRHDSGIPFMVRNGPVWHRLRDGRYEGGFLPAPEVHGNLYGYVHGGMLAAFADFALGHACWFANERARVVTVHLDINFVTAAKVGTWIGCEVEIVRKTRSLCFPRGDFVAEGQVLATASGVWKIIGA
ncbi:MAG TPA: PaaI family thioesterase [Paracoccaceae bacterium]|nr:PaaI family thioesterase [Paracoccaceae bacterium]